MFSPTYRPLIDTIELEPECRLEIVAHELGISRERARQLECRPLWKLQQAIAARGYRLGDRLDAKPLTPPPEARTGRSDRPERRER